MLRRQFFTFVTGAALALPIAVRGQPMQSGTASPDAASIAKFALLPGRWVRTDGGYVITIKAVDAKGNLDASYENPNLLPFYSAVATSDGGLLELSFELRAGGYGGSTYKLTLDASNDRLKGIYYQAVAKKNFEVVFVRSK
jgi:hypothetical protein